MDIKDVQFKQILNMAIGGFGVFKSVSVVANEFMNDKRYSSREERISAVIKWQSYRCLATGFLTGMKGLLNVPLQVVGLIPSFFLKVRLVGVILELHGYNAASEKGQCLILMAIFGNTITDIVKDKLCLTYGIKVVHKTSYELALQHPDLACAIMYRALPTMLPRILLKNKIKSIKKQLPVIGGVINGSLDFASCQAVGRAADKLATHG